MNVNKLKGKIVEKEMSITQLAKEIGIDRSSLYRKLNNEGDTLSIKEANRIVEILGLTREESIAIFFNSFVACSANYENERNPLHI
ncbi:helix-turn-helix transcriptional regulator [Oceanobacillus sp. FSL W8-0428]|uniref:helix-turn-helix domain-containing protein n=1 Tax=Oceanobacillus sp. FSL W8-0428 TaxID=2921715 RepID=UPI0030F4F907